MKLTVEQLAAIKEIEKKLFESFIAVCEELHLTYYLLGGTLLGAVRHKGFIPWDDDIDVGMPRADYEIFLQKGQQLLPEGYFLQSYLSEPDYPNCFAKIRNSNTTYLETSVRNCDINHGVFIDIFPLDYYPDDKKARKRLGRKKILLNLRISAVYRSKSKSFKARFLRLLLKIRWPSYKIAVRKRETLYKSVLQSTMLANHGGAWGRKEIVPIEWYGEGTLLEFEGLSVRAPVAYDKWLSQVYGDYMQLPPADKRSPHHYVDVIDFEKSYREYVGKGVTK